MRLDRPRSGSTRDLSKHREVRFRDPNTGKLLDWPMLLASADPQARPRTVLACDNMEAVLGGALRGLGIACAPDFLVKEAMERGHLLSVLDPEFRTSGRFKAIWASNRHLSPRSSITLGRGWANRPGTLS